MPLSTNSLIVLVSSLMIVPCGVIIKKLTRGRSISRDQEWEDWFLGIELIFSALTSALFKALEAVGFIQGKAALSPEQTQRYIIFSIWMLFIL